ncbi:Hypothetical protein, putative [Bodo saltans]|uniref:Uncharacterized protein n=1 Tax=Bodo saltans TaxID=75058 RepID=A0A0S4J2U3_BODSA|nr:Hypothetical protein, putative [Bodo saltans]|eukprot:CUG24356.1 Hypothetical protein, putative [Bodo saltans]
MAAATVETCESFSSVSASLTASAAANTDALPKRETWRPESFFYNDHSCVNPLNAPLSCMRKLSSLE